MQPAHQYVDSFLLLFLVRTTYLPWGFDFLPVGRILSMKRRSNNRFEGKFIDGLLLDFELCGQRVKLWVNLNEILNDVSWDFYFI